MRLLLLHILILAGCAGYTQSHFIGLDECKKAALDYSNTIKNGKIRIQSAEYEKKSAVSNYYPSVSATGVAAYGFRNFINAIPPFLNKGVSNLYFGGLTAMEPIYVGGKVNTANKLAELQVETRKIMARQSVDSVLLQTEQKYWTIVQLQEQLKTLGANEQLLDTILKQQNDMLVSGLIARNDLLKSRVRRSQLLLNRSQLENARKIAVFDLTLYIGILYDSLLVVKDTLGEPPSPDAQFISPEMALETNNSYHLLEKNVQAETLQTKLAKADLLPAISLGFGAGDFGSFGNSVIGNKFIPLALGTVSFPISDNFWGSGKYKLQQRRLNETIAHNDLADGERQLKVGILKDWYDLSDSYKQIGFAHENMEEATENLKVSRDNYSSGLSDITDLLNAQATYREAAGELVNAYANYHLKLANYLYITGKLR